MYISQVLFFLEWQQRCCLKYNVYLPSSVYPRTTTRFLSQIQCIYMSQVSLFLEFQQGFCLKYIVCLPSSVNPRIPTVFFLKYIVYFPISVYHRITTCLSLKQCILPMICLSYNYNNVFVSSTMYIYPVSFFLERQQGFCLKYIVYLPSPVNPRIPTRFLSQIHCIFPNFCLS